MHGNSLSRVTFVKVCLFLAKGFLCALATLPFASFTYGDDKAAVDSGAAKAPVATPEQAEFFTREVSPILKENCHKCHAGEKVKGGLQLTSRAAMLSGGETGPAISLDKPGASLLLAAVEYRDLKMPPDKKLPPEKIAVLAKWISEGALFAPGSEVAFVPAEKAETKIDPAAANWWAYRPVAAMKPPEVKQKEWVTNPIDQFILSKLEEKGLTPNGPADRIALVRRAYYDLTGLPPKPEEVDAFVNDASPGAYEQLIDRLLESPHYGEKWGRHWLDVVRYAETNGYERDGDKPFAWRYRDYVIDSFNNDKPYDQFIREQLAGDELPGENPEAIIATGFYRLGLWDDEPADRLQARFDELDDFVSTTSQAFLGMGMNCTRCHTHKADPIPHADYYRLVSFFADIQYYSDDRNPGSSANLTDISDRHRKIVYEPKLRKLEEKKRGLKAEMERIEDEAIARMPDEEKQAAATNDRPAVLAKRLKEFLSKEGDQKYNELKKKIAELESTPKPKQEMALSVNNCIRVPPVMKVRLRGNPHLEGDEVKPGFPQVFAIPDPEIPPPAKGVKSSGRRSVLANWIASPENPLTARVFVNRLWLHHFGRGIVPTPNDFGKLGSLPTHPELLDFLAKEFVANGWRIKPMHRLIMLSSAYRMSSKGSESGLAQDGNNNLFWRFNMRRLSAEEVRDTVLSMSGRLNLKAGGPSIYPPISKEVLAGQSKPGNGWATSPPDEAARRSVFVFIKRSLQVPVLSVHDQPDTDSSCPMRYVTTVPTQALGMLNGDFTGGEARVMAERLEREFPNETAKQVARAIRLTTGRLPAEAEIASDVAFLASLAEKQKLSPNEALRVYCLMCLSTNELMYLD